MGRSLRTIGSTDATRRAPTVSWKVANRSSMELAAKLGEKNIGVGVGNCYAYRLMEALDIDPDDGVVRTSLVHYTSGEEVENLITTLDQLL